jgi:starch phosphorylase
MRIHVPRREQLLSGAASGYLYVGQVPADRPARDYTPRVVPAHPDAVIPAEA